MLMYSRTLVIYNLLSGLHDFDYYIYLTNSHINKIKYMFKYTDVYDKKTMYDSYHLARKLEFNLYARKYEQLDYECKSLLSILIAQDICPD